MTRAAEDTAILASFVDELPVGVWVARAPGGEFLYANRRFAEILGTGGRADVGRGEYAQPYGIHTRAGELYPEERMPFVRALAERTTVEADDLVIHRHDGRQVNVRAFAEPIFDGDGDGGGQITHVIIAFFDITREVVADRQRAESEARLALAQRMEAIGQLAGGIAHDFNNLLTVARSLSSSLLKTEDDPERRRALQMIDEVGERAMQLTQGLLGFAARGEGGSPTTVALHDLLRPMTELLRRTLPPAISVELELGAEPSHVTGDRSQLEQVFMNLAVNARDAMPDGGRLSVRTRGDGERVVLEVSDTGPGIDPALRARVFEPYFTTKTSGAVRGSGLGLATVAGIVERHHGTVEVVDGGPGATIRITLPSAPAPALARLEPGSSPGTLTRAVGGTILIVEDERLVRAATARVVKQLGYGVLACADGDEAIELYRARRGEICAVLLDMLMPKMSGPETFHALRELDPEVVVVLTAGSVRRDEIDELLAEGARAFIPKPYDTDALAGALSRVLQSSAG